MDHGKKYKKLGRKSSHRISMLNNMTCSLLLHNKIVTTLTKAKCLRPYVEREFVTPAKKSGMSLSFSRKFRSMLKNEEAIKKLSELSKVTFISRNGGYLRIIKLGRRTSDQSEMALIEFVE